VIQSLKSTNIKRRRKINFDKASFITVVNISLSNSWDFLNFNRVRDIVRIRMASPTKLTVAIAGAGIAGLAVAIGLRDHPHIEVQIYEKAKRLEEIGASIALGPNGMRTLERLGIENALDDSVAFRNQSGYPMIYR
jgi:NAD(P)-binding Rossmann-like domain